MFTQDFKHGHYCLKKWHKMIINKTKVCGLTNVSFCSLFMECKTPPLETLAFLSEALKEKTRIRLSKRMDLKMLTLKCLRRIKKSVYWTTESPMHYSTWLMHHQKILDWLDKSSFTRAITWD